MQSRTVYSLLTASALALSMGGALAAQDQSQSGMSGGMQSESGTTGMQDQGTTSMGGMSQQQAQTGQIDISNKYSASSLQNLKVQDSQGQQLGNISDVLIDQDGTVSHVVVAEGSGVFGLGGGKKYLVPWDQVQIDDQQQTASINVSQDQLSTEFSAFEELPPTALDQQQQSSQQQDQMGSQQESGDSVMQSPSDQSDQGVGSESGIQ